MLKKYFEDNRYYKILLSLSFLLAVLWIAIVNTQPFSDFSYYHNLAIEISNGKPWGDTYTSVGYPVILGYLYKIFGCSILVGKLFNLFLLVINNLLFLSILKRLNIKENHKKLISLLFILFPNNIFYTSILGTETLFTSILLLVTRIYFSDIRYKYIYIGILVGINTLIKPFFIIYFLVILLSEIFITRRLVKPLINSLIILLFSIICISPWVYRNTKLMGEFTYVSNNSGIVLYINNNSENNKGRWMPAADVKDSIVNTQQYKDANMTDKNKMLSKAAKEWIKTHPKQFIVLGNKRLLNTYLVGDDIGYSLWGTTINAPLKISLYTVTNLIRSIIFIPGIIFLVAYLFKSIIFFFKKANNRIDPFNIYITFLFFMFSSIYFITEGQGRYAFPLIFILVYSFYFFVNHFIDTSRHITKNNE